MENAKTALLGKTLSELKVLVSKAGLPSFAGKQVAEWIYGRKVKSIDEMTNISLKNREALKAMCLCIWATSTGEPSTSAAGIRWS